MGDEKSPIDRVLDATLFAPLGFLLTRDETFETLAAAGRKQIAFSRSLGRAALKGIARGAQGPEGGPTPAPKAKASGPDRTKPGATVDGFAEMTAKEVIAFIATCSDAEAMFIREAELAGKNRVTVVRALDARG